MSRSQTIKVTGDIKWKDLRELIQRNAEVPDDARVSLKGAVFHPRESEPQELTVSWTVRT